MRDLAIAFLIFAWVPAILMYPYLGVYAWSWISYMNPHRLGYDYITSWPVAEIVGIATLVAWLFSKEPKRIPMHFLTIMIIVMMVFTSITTWFSLDRALSYEKWDQTMKILLFALVTCGLVTTRTRLIGLVWIIVVSLGFYGIKGGLFTVATGGRYHVWGPEHSFIDDNNALAMALVMTVPLMRFLQLQTPVAWIKWALGGSIAITIFAIFGTQSRGALLAIIAMMVVLVLKSRRKAFVLIASLLAMAVALVFMPKTWTDRMMTIESYEEDSSAQGRIEMWAFAIEIAKQHPFMGGGYAVFANPVAQQKYIPAGITAREPHSIYFELGEHGYTGLIIFVTILIGTFYYGGRTIRLTKNDPELTWAQDLASMIQVSLVGYAVAGSFLTLATFDLYWHIVAMVAITDRLVMRAIEQRKAPQGAADEVLTTTSARLGYKAPFTV